MQDLDASAPAILEAYRDGTLRTVRARGDEALVRAVIERAARVADAQKWHVR
jgi:hypothetical protein